MVYGLLVTSVVCWNAAFFGNAITAWLVIPAIAAWIWLIIQLDQTSASWKSVFWSGFFWGATCLAPQFWWLIRSAMLYPNIWGFGGGIIFFTLFLGLFSFTHGIYTLIAVYLSRVLPRFMKIFMAPVLCALYFVYLANYSFTPLGEPKGYPFFWPFLPLGRSAIFLDTLATLRHNPNHDWLYAQLATIDFIQIPQAIFIPTDTPKSPYYISERLRRSIITLLPTLSPTKPTVIVTPESGFPYPIEQCSQFSNLWWHLLPDNCHLLVAAQRELATPKPKTVDSLQRWIAGSNVFHISKNCQTIAWFDHTQTPTFFDKQALCPFTELGLREGEPHLVRAIPINKLNFIPIICFDFFHHLSWLSTTADNEIPILHANESWFPYQTYELIHNFAYIVSIWYDKPIIYASTTRAQPWTRYHARHNMANATLCLDEKNHEPCACQARNENLLNWSVVDLSANLPTITQERII
jgi:apolipoprotein N-acyltransferase